MHPTLKSSSQKRIIAAAFLLSPLIYLGVPATLLEAGWFADHPDSDCVSRLFLIPQMLNIDTAWRVITIW